MRTVAAVRLPEMMTFVMLELWFAVLLECEGAVLGLFSEGISWVCGRHLALMREGCKLCGLLFLLSERKTGREVFVELFYSFEKWIGDEFAEGIEVMAERSDVIESAVVLLNNS